MIFIKNLESLLDTKAATVIFSIIAFVTVGLGLWWWLLAPRAPGVAVAVIGAAAAVMSLHSDQKWWQKAMWLCGIGFLLAAELKAIHKDRDEAHKQYLADGKAQDDKFAGIIKTQTDLITNTVSGFKSTQGRVNDVLSTTNRVSEMARENLYSLTGGDSYAYVYPDIYSNAPNVADLKIHNNGNYTLTSVQIQMGRVLSGVRLSLTTDLTYSTEVAPPMNIGTLAPDSGRNLMAISPMGTLQVVLDRDNTAQYLLHIYSQRRGEAEVIDFRKDAQGYLEFKYYVFESVDRSRRVKGDTYLPNTTHKYEWRHVLKTAGWTKIQPSPF